MHLNRQPQMEKTPLAEKLLIIIVTYNTLLLQFTILNRKKPYTQKHLANNGDDDDLKSNAIRAADKISTSDRERQDVAKTTYLTE